MDIKLIVSNKTGQFKVKWLFCACSMFAKNRVNRNKFNNKAKANIKNSYFILLIQKDINAHV